MGYKAGGARGEQNPVPLGLLRSSPCSHAFCPLPRSTMSCVAELCPLPCGGRRRCRCCPANQLDARLSCCRIRHSAQVHNVVPSAALVQLLCDQFAIAGQCLPVRLLLWHSRQL